MKEVIVGLICCCFTLQAQNHYPNKGLSQNVMSEAYWKIWNPEVQSFIDQNIEKNRKADAILDLKQIPSGTIVKVEQLKHSFLFGGNIFLFGQLQTPEQNKLYEDTYGELFNAATIAFYWKTLESEQGKPRYETGSSYIFRRPPVDPVVNFCEKKGIMPKGHAIIYGSRSWGQPAWMPEDRKAMEFHFENHIKELAIRYGDRVKMWDVVNEPVDQANRGAMPDDYTYKTYKWAMQYFPSSVILNINDVDIHSGLPYTRRYLEIVRNLISRGIRIDNVGLQMHIFSSEEPKRIAKGEEILTPSKIYDVLKCLDDAGRPIQISEVTVCAPDTTAFGKEIQSVITRNLYRLWFSYANITGITWWNVVDGGAASGEPSFSGLYDKDMKKKPVYSVLDQLINHDWKTSFTTKMDKSGTIRFRGFKGHYRATWKGKKGRVQTMEFDVK
ncbi:MAG: endo-1,4-beta-xylanase [Parabacteroides sp.]|nr:endo-1,4-beta-xylanase [Parabacteroides sp.]